MKSLIISLKALLVFTILTGVFYPLFITGLVQFIFPVRANGSLIKLGDNVIGSALIGQQFDSLYNFSSRPSAINYNPMPSGGSNYGLTNQKLKDLVYLHRSQFIRTNKLDSLKKIPPEMVFSSASGLDPHISPEAAYMQADRIAIARKYNDQQKIKLRQLIKNQTEEPQIKFLGNARVNVLLLNLEINSIK
jgi:potassium-transporting ATPase KdpC subunit